MVYLYDLIVAEVKLYEVRKVFCNELRGEVLRNKFYLILCEVKILQLRQISQSGEHSFRLVQFVCQKVV